jgi:uncharacterized protein YPO0396
MSDIIPPEDDITKRQLWERMDSIRAAIESHKGEIIYKMDTVRENVKSDVGNLNSEHNLLILKKMGEINDWLKTFKTDVSRTDSNSATEIRKLLKDHVAQVDLRIKEISDSIGGIVKVEAENLFSDAVKRISILEEKYAIFASAMNDAISRFQVETRTKVGDLKHLAERIVSKLKDGFQDL